MWVIPNSLSSRAGGNSSSSVPLSLPHFAVWIYFSRCWISVENHKAVLLLKKADADTQICAHMQTENLFIFLLLCGQMFLPWHFPSSVLNYWKLYWNKIDNRSRLTEQFSPQDTHMESATLFSLLKWRYMHSSLSDHKTGVAYGWVRRYIHLFDGFYQTQPWLLPRC